MIVVARRAPRPNRPPLTGHRPAATARSQRGITVRGAVVAVCCSCGGTAGPQYPSGYSALPTSCAEVGTAADDALHRFADALSTSGCAACHHVQARQRGWADAHLHGHLRGSDSHGLWVWTTSAVVGQSSPCAKEARAWTPWRGQSYDVAVFTRDSRFTDWAYEVFTQPRPLMAGPPALCLLRVRGLRLLGLWIQPRRRDVGVGSRTGRRAHVLQRTTPLRFAKVSSAWPLCSTEASRTAAVVDCPDAFGIRRLSKISAQFFCLAGIDRS